MLKIGRARSRALPSRGFTRARTARERSRVCSVCSLLSPFPFTSRSLLPAPCSLSGLLHPLPLELRHLQRPRGARQKAPGLEGPRAPAAHGVVPRAQLAPDAVAQPLGELARPRTVHARRHHRELGGPDAAERIGATPARL